VDSIICFQVWSAVCFGRLPAFGLPELPTQRFMLLSYSQAFGGFSLSGAAGAAGAFGAAGAAGAFGAAGAAGAFGAAGAAGAGIGFSPFK
jgi:hypothetical protein